MHTHDPATRPGGEQAPGIRLTLVRGGTSRGVIVDRRELRSPVAESVPDLLRVFGAPHANQLDGLGGLEPRTNKLAVVGPSDVDGCDLDYQFGQVSRDKPHIDFSGTCGNLSAAVALHAALEGGHEPGDDGVRVVLHDVNTGGRIGGRVLLGHDDGGLSGREPGTMPATGTPVLLDFAGMAGSATGSLLPTGAARDRMRLPDGTEVEASVVDVANPIVFVDAERVGAPAGQALRGADLGALRPRMEQLRACAAGLMGWTRWDPDATRLPFVILVSALTGQVRADGDGLDLAGRMYAVGRFHEAIAGTGAANAAAAALLPGTVVEEALAGRRATGGRAVPVRVHHASGTLAVEAALTRRHDGSLSPGLLEYHRTARRIMEGRAFL